MSCAGYACWTSDLPCGRVGIAHVGSTSKLLVHGNPAVGYVVATIAIEVQALSASLVSFVSRLLPSQLTHILVLSQWMGWSSIHMCSAMADLSVRPLMQLATVHAGKPWHSYKLMSPTTQLHLPWGGLEHLVTRYISYKVKFTRKRTFHH